jgi:hypothetical protein
LIREDVAQKVVGNKLVNDVDLLFQLVPDHFISEETIDYLRPHFDAGLLALLQSNDAPPRQLLRYVFLTVTGKMEIKTDENEDLLVFYRSLSTKAEYVVYRQRNSEIRCFELPVSESGGVGLLPKELTTALSGAARTVAVVWRPGDEEKPDEFPRELPVEYRVLP